MKKGKDPGPKTVERPFRRASGRKKKGAGSYLCKRGIEKSRLRKKGREGYYIA